MTERVRRIKLLTVFVTILSFTILYHSPGRSDTSFSWPMFIQAFTGGVCKIGPFWGVYTRVCCRDSSATFSVTVSGTTKRSTAASCAAVPTWEGWTETTAGTKSVSWQIRSPTCGTYSGTFPWIMDKGKYYGYQLEIVNGGLVVFVYSWNACSVVENTSVIKSFQQVEEIRLDIPLGSLRTNSMSVNLFQTVP